MSQEQGSVEEGGESKWRLRLSDFVLLIIPCLLVGSINGDACLHTYV